MPEPTRVCVCVCAGWGFYILIILFSALHFPLRRACGPFLDNLFFSPLFYKRHCYGDRYVGQARPFGPSTFAVLHLFRAIVCCCPILSPFRNVLRSILGWTVERYIPSQHNNNPGVLANCFSMFFNAIF